MSYQVVTDATQAVSGNTFDVAFTNEAVIDASFFVIVFRGQDGFATQGSKFQIGANGSLITSSDYDMQSFFIQGGASAGVTYHEETNKGFWYMDNSNFGSNSFSTIYLAVDQVTSRPLCCQVIASETTLCQMAGWLDVSMTNFGQITFIGESGYDIKAGSRATVYKVVRA